MCGKKSKISSQGGGERFIIGQNEQWVTTLSPENFLKEMKKESKGKNQQSILTNHVVQRKQRAGSWALNALERGEWRRIIASVIDTLNSKHLCLQVNIMEILKMLLLLFITKNNVAEHQEVCSTIQSQD